MDSANTEILFLFFKVVFIAVIFGKIHLVNILIAGFCVLFWVIGIFSISKMVKDVQTKKHTGIVLIAIDVFLMKPLNN